MELAESMNLVFTGIEFYEDWIFWKKLLKCMSLTDQMISYE